MKYLVYLIFVITVCMVSCSRSEEEYGQILNSSESMMQINPDSAVSMLDQIDASELVADSLKAKYHYLKAWGHLQQNRSMIADSLVSFAYDYYRGKDVLRDIRSGTAYAWYKFWIGDTNGALELLDSLISVPELPDSLLVQTLRVRVLLGASEYQGKELLPLVKRLMILESDVDKQLEAKTVLLAAYEYAGELDTALMIIDELHEYAYNNKLGDMQFYFELERAQILGEMGREEESDKVIENIFAKSSPNNGAADYLHIQLAINALNKGNIQRAYQELAIADCFADSLRSEDDTYYRTYSNLLHVMIDFKNHHKMKLSHVNALNNRQYERFNRMKASQWESERSALQQQSRALALKAESQHKTVIILIVALAALLILGTSIWIIRNRRQRERDMAERAEALQNMVEELKTASASTTESEHVHAALRRAMLQQLGIVKMVAETPTEQNQDLLRKISALDGDSSGELVRWENLFEIIDNLYDGFYRRLHDKYENILLPKEEQIIVLLVAGFTTKEISVITSQTTSTIYVRKSSIRKKLGVPEKEDIVMFLRTEFKRVFKNF